MTIYHAVYAYMYKKEMKHYKKWFGISEIWNKNTNFLFYIEKWKLYRKRVKFIEKSVEFTGERVEYTEKIVNFTEEKVHFTDKKVCENKWMLNKCVPNMLMYLSGYKKTFFIF